MRFQRSRFLVLLLLVVLLAVPGAAAISANAVWDVRQAGSNNNGCFFVTGGSGTNYSTGGATFHAAITTLSVVNATTTKLTISLTDYTVSLQDVNNGYHNTGGTSTAGWYEIIAVDTVLNTWTLDRSIGTAAQTATGKMGGSCGLPSFTAVVSTSNKIYVKCDATYTTGVSLAFSLANGVLVQGYNATQGDLGCSPTLQATAGSFTLWNVAAGAGSRVSNFILDCNNQTSSIALTFTSSGSMIEHLTASNCKGTALSFSAGASAQFVTVTGQFSGTSFSFNGNQSCIWCVVTTPGTGTGAAFTFAGDNVECDICIGVGNSSAAGVDVFIGGGAPLIKNSACLNAGRDCVRFSCSTDCPKIFNSTFYGAVGWCLNFTTAGTLAEEDYNALGNCNTGGGTGTRNNVTAGTHDVTLTASPFTNAPTDLSPNTTSGGGAAIRGVGYPGNLGVGTGFLTIGGLQPQTNVAVQTVH